MPWETGASEGKYRYHPGGNQANAPKDAPSAVNVVVVPDVNLPKVSKTEYTISHSSPIGITPNPYPPLFLSRGQDVRYWLHLTEQHLHDKWNKWGKDGY
jgi:hypothetical protein